MCLTAPSGTLLIRNFVTEKLTEKELEKVVKLYTENDENQIIWMLDSKNELVSLSSCSQIVKALLKMKNQTNKRIYFPKEIL